MNKSAYADVDYEPLHQCDIQEAYLASITVAETLLRLHGLEEPPEDCAHTFWDDLDRVLNILGLKQTLISPLPIPEEGKETA